MNSSKNILQIVPRLFPSIDGVGDYALNIANSLVSEHKISSDFLVGNFNWKGPEKLDNFLIITLNSRNDSKLLKILSNYTNILLHYVGYGYEKRGCPNWLINSIIEWKKQKEDNNLVVMFHEVYATSYKPWKSSFWLSKRQKYIASTLLNLSDHVYTSNNYYSTILSSLSKKNLNPINTLPVISNIGEPLITLDLTNRNKSIVVFGSEVRRRLVYKNELEKIRNFCKQYKIQVLYDIGKSLDINIKKIINFVEIKELGILQASEVSNILSNSIGGISSFNHPKNIAKSGVFASYCSHKVLPLVFFQTNNIYDELISGKNYLSLTENFDEFNLDKLQEIANSAYLWYHGHNLKKQSKEYSNVFT